ncbi:uncharacterized protein LACBIDRAFT_304146 [Laccaria bicolor S238N-H82]|uniref:Predicted protein n=1 Tax=Laccaria bicolor (strain S238N-H82 / ATCC MYA-4686) TaxID=486041 RepID=B0DL21_LACBS|nr:uncharacterized protein LACBIDRAFT_304146 [Laccaria bicolor S238N-H82]EDR04750.1 predicted protein [Laccaria bicolor S238N-H82]|eukprot:XP_001884574.1 predicted protein [Laccaria bicolor S238N-H82]
MVSELSSVLGEFLIGPFTRSCCEAEFHGGVTDALPQLVVYLASLRQSRLNKGRSNTSVYGVVTDGFAFVFVIITHEGILKESRLFDLTHGYLSIVLGCFHIHLGDCNVYVSKFDARKVCVA